MVLTLQIVLVVTSLILGLSVLLHKGKGGGLSSLFGGGMQSSLSGSTVVEKNLDRLTVTTAVIWIAAIVGLNLVVHYNVG
ncbi:preprotein translocase subunit SecG [Corynebacterium kalidii]|jgi:preprotein translocase subunit SecG|uniref:Protein-export membrane protein SecG n=1 Tax=Corynebacterium kalidii TaxID=2931982 RepID=A0A9X1WIG7_9CORY|nr:preprotein translocase subunit SecG [Corynebacterium kalidii]MCJ7859669.1 preprotein translocase subunit SecG [Corynebacterium kalidii]